MEFTLLTASEFQIFSDSFAQGNLYQTVDIASFRKSQGAEIEFVGIKQHGTISAAAMVSSRKTQFGREYSAPGGFLIDYRDLPLLGFFIRHLRLHLESRNTIALHFSPRVCRIERDIDGVAVQGGFDNSAIITNLKKFGCHHHQPAIELNPGRADLWNFQLSLIGHTEASLLASFRQTTRQSIRKALEKGVTVREIEEYELPIFTDLITASAKRNGTLAKNRAYYERALAHFTRSIKVRLFVAEKEGTLLSAGMFLYYDQAVHYVYAGTPSEFLVLNPQFVIVWETMKTALADGYELYDFGGISGDFGQKADHNGLYTFKRGFRGHVVEYIGNFTLVISPPRYELYTRWKRFQRLTLGTVKQQYAKLT